MTSRRRVESKYPDDWPDIAARVKADAGWTCVRCQAVHNPRDGYCLTVHHLDGDKSNCRWWNIPALCQRCHLSIQGRVKMSQYWPFEHSQWFKIYVAGWYAHIYLHEDVTRDEATERLERLLALERVV